MENSTIPRGLFVLAKRARARMEKIFPNSDDLSCYCGVASLYLAKCAKELGYSKVNFVMGIYCDSHYRVFEPNHCWCEIDNYIIDITATQFGIKKKVSITNTKNKDYMKLFSNKRAEKEFTNSLFY